MKLLKKSTINIEAARERKQEIDEGIALAQRVDSLRRTLADLEEQQQQFIAGMQGELEKATNDLLNEITQRKIEIEYLEEKRKQLLIPLDAEWNKINAKHNELEAIKLGLNSKDLQLTVQHEKNVALGKSIKERLIQVKIRERQLIKSNEQAEDNRKQTEDILAKSILDRDALNAYIQVNTQDILSREAAVAVREKETELAKETLINRERDLIIRTALIQDREQTLDRELKRQQ